MTSDTGKPEAVEQLLDTPELATALESEQFKKFLDQVPIAIAVSDLIETERVVYANPEFEKLSGLKAASLARKNWAALSGTGIREQKDRALAESVINETDFVGTFRLERGVGGPAVVDAYSNLIVDDDGKTCFRLVALVDVSSHGEEAPSVEERVREKDTLLRELQHRVKNNLQMITALIRLETRNAAEPDQKRFERLAGRVDALAILYQALSNDEQKDEVDLGIYLSQIASAVMASHGFLRHHLVGPDLADCGRYRRSRFWSRCCSIGIICSDLGPDGARKRESPPGHSGERLEQIIR